MKTILFGLFWFPMAICAQVGINTTVPRAVLEVKSSNEATPANTDGILIPKLSAFPAINPNAAQDGMMVYLTNAVGTNAAGFYYWSNPAATWLAVAAKSGWSLQGNNGTTAANFIGTTDDTPLSFRVSDVASGKIDSISRSTFFGYESGKVHTTAIGNTGFGYRTLKSNTSGSENVAIGVSALRANVSGFANTAVGYATLVLNTGNRNTAVGHGALTRNTTGNENNAIGWGAIGYNTTGWYNIANGSLALLNLQTGNGNVANGYRSLALVVSTSNNSGYGYQAGSTLTGSVNNATCIGANSGFSTTPSNHVNIGNTSTVWIGGQVNWGTFSDARTKDNITENVKGLAFIKKLRPVTYNFNYNKEYELLNEGSKDTTAVYPGKYDIEKIKFSGFIAQEVEMAAQQSDYDFSGVVPPPNGRGAYTVRYAEFVVPLVKAVQEQQNEIDTLKTEIAEIKKLLQDVVKH